MIIKHGKISWAIHEVRQGLVAVFFSRLRCSGADWLGRPDVYLTEGLVPFCRIFEVVLISAAAQGHNITGTK